ncbi:hypothetical protein G9A89_015517 [Geosiphon pyriformis]|nr:hypothetical protein G9A89_015517 [Geosiphon pyriformis]
MIVTTVFEFGNIKLIKIQLIGIALGPIVYFASGNNCAQSWHSFEKDWWKNLHDQLFSRDWQPESLCHATLECFLELLMNQVSGILRKLNGMEIVPIATPFSVSSPVTSTPLVSHLDVDMALDDIMLAFASPFSAVDNMVYDSSLSFSKVLTSKVVKSTLTTFKKRDQKPPVTVGRLESKMIAFKVSISLVLERLDCLYSGLNSSALLSS